MNSDQEMRIEAFSAIGEIRELCQYYKDRDNLAKEILKIIEGCEDRIWKIVKKGKTDV